MFVYLRQYRSAIDIPHSCDPSSSSSFSLHAQVNMIWNIPEFLHLGGKYGI